jgi:hypothetical protein
MRFKGISVRKTNKFGWRNAKPGDIDADGKPITGAYVVIVDFKDCPESHERGNTTYYDCKDAPPAFPHSHSRTDMVYGKRKKVYNGRDGKYARDENGVEVWTYDYSYVEVFVVKDAQVYRGRCGYKLIAPKEAKTA